MPSPIVFSRLLGCLALAFLVHGCDIVNINDRLLNSADKRITAYELLPPSMAWASIPGQLPVIQRTIGSEVEQIVSLPNSTSIPGENSLILRASRRGGEKAGRLRLEALRARIGGFPAPFADLEAEQTFTMSDRLGPYSYSVKTFGDITCVLALRKVNGADRLIPNQRNALDAVLRNCTTGSIEEALMPIRDESFGYANFVGSAAASGTRLLSPLSAPMPE